MREPNKQDIDVRIDYFKLVGLINSISKYVTKHILKKVWVFYFVQNILGIPVLFIIIILPNHFYPS